MSAITGFGSVVRQSSSNTTGARMTKGRYAKIALATTAVATLANVIIYFLADIFVAYHPDFLILENVSPTIMFTVIPAVLGSLLYAALLRFTANPVRIFTIVAAIVFVIVTIPDFTYIPGVDGASNAQTAVLVIFHVVAATIITGMLTKLAPKGS